MTIIIPATNGSAILDILFGVPMGYNPLCKIRQDGIDDVFP
jgi:hypothetical protein